MAIELVTGFAGEPHIASEDVGAYNAATMGTGSYILSGCAVTMSSTTKMHIAAGELLIQGRHVRITGTGIDLAVASGTTGYNRIDLAVIHYSKASTGVETVAVEIVKGTPTTGTAAAPSTSGGSILNGDSAAYITLAQVAITGLTVGTPTRKLSTFTSLASVQDSVSQISKTATASFTGGTAVKLGRLVVVTVENVTITSNIWRDLGTLPSSMRPSVAAYGAVTYNEHAGQIGVFSDGTVAVFSAASGDFTGQVVYLLEAS